jgi:hypothetical protein
LFTLAFSIYWSSGSDNGIRSRMRTARAVGRGSGYKPGNHKIIALVSLLLLGLGLGLWAETCSGCMQWSNDGNFSLKHWLLAFCTPWQARYLLPAVSLVANRIWHKRPQYYSALPPQKIRQPFHLNTFSLTQLFPILLQHTTSSQSTQAYGIMDQPDSERAPVSFKDRWDLLRADILQY